MIAIIKHVVETVIDGYRFVSAVWHDARALQAEAHAKYSHLGF